MRILPVIPNVFLQRNDFKNNHYNDYSQYSTVLRSPLVDTFEKVSFGASGPESVNPSRKVFDRLPQERLTCPCCGRVMIPPSEIDELRYSHALDCKAPEAIRVLQKYEKNMHSVEKEVFHILKAEAKKHPNMDFKEILNEIKPKHELDLIETQYGIFRLIEKASEDLPEYQKKEIKTLIESEKIKIWNGSNEFRRKRFVTRFEEIVTDTENRDTRERLIRIAKKLPTAYEDKNAFIIKYSNRPAEEIGIRLISYSMRTIEHVKPKNRDGENHIFNYIPECMRCNSFRQDRPMIQQLEEYPEMFANTQRLMNTLIEFANMHMISPWYIIKIQQRLYEESDHVLKPDISALRLETHKLKVEYSKLNTLDLESETPVKKTKKEKRREKIKANRNKKYKNKKV